MHDVLADNSNRHVTISTDDDLKKKTTRKRPAKPTADAAPKLKPDDSIIGHQCPKCQQGTIIKGKTAYGCSNWKSGCDFRLPFTEENNTQKQ